MQELAFEIAAWVLTIAGLAVIGWALFWDRSRGRRRCPKCWYDMGGAKADGEGRLTCSECGRVVRRERKLHKTRRRWRRAIAGVCVLGLAYAAVATPRVRERGWAGAVPTTALAIGSHAILSMFAESAHGPAGFFGLATPNVLRDLAHELCERIDRTELRRWQAWFVVRACLVEPVVGASDSGLLFGLDRWHLTVNSAVRFEQRLQLGPTFLRPGQHAWARSWQVLVDRGYVTDTELRTALRASDVRITPSRIGADRSVDVEVLLALPHLGDGRAVIIDLGPPDQPALYRWYCIPAPPGWQAHKERFPPGDFWPPQIVMLPPGHEHTAVCITISLQPIEGAPGTRNLSTSWTVPLNIAWPTRSRKWIQRARLN